MISTTRFHFKSAQGWINDPNGLVYLAGKYHLFFQHHPGAAVWGPMHWGHAVSTDLIEWTELPIALEPDALGYIYSGSVIADTENRFALSRSGETPLIAFFTHHDRDAFSDGKANVEYQSAAVSWDEGRTWTKHQANPILPNPGDKRDFRDPFVFWHKESQAWIMVVSAGSHSEIYRSATLTGWQLTSRFDAGLPADTGTWECPVLCQVPLENGLGHRWLFIQSFNPGGRYGGSGTRYFVGDFDGYKFEVEAPFRSLLAKQGPQWLDWGPDHYAGNVWGNSPSEDGKPILLGWMNNWAYANHTFETPFRGRMTLPRQLSLVAEGQALVARSEPIPSMPSIEIKQGETPLPEIGENDLAILKLETEINQGESAQIVFKSSSKEVIVLRYCSIDDEFTLDRTAATPADVPDISSSIFRFPRISRKVTVDATICLSKGGIEFYLDDGVQSATMLFDPHQKIETIDYNCWNKCREDFARAANKSER